ncbi:flavanone 3-dioxygenase 3-like protein [Tanacetum coccineum]
MTRSDSSGLFGLEWPAWSGMIRLGLSGLLGPCVGSVSYHPCLWRQGQGCSLILTLAKAEVLFYFGRTGTSLSTLGSQVLAVNCYPSCPEPDLALGTPPHTDHGTLTILHQSHQGLEIMDHDKKWHSVPFIEGALIIQLGDQSEIMSNERHKSTQHRAILNMQKMRLSIACIHSLAIEKKIGPAPELVDEQHPVAYKEGSFAEFLDYIALNSGSDVKYIDTLRIH